MSTPHISPPRHGGQLPALAARFGLDPVRLLDLSANINPAGPPASALAALQQALTDPAALTHYPDLESTSLRQAIASYAGITPEQVVVANGFAPLLDATLRALSVRSCTLPVPAFNEYRATLALNHVTVTPHALDPGQNFRYQNLPLDSQALLLANPQNPTGILHPAETLLPLARQTMLLLDEAFIDYTPAQTLAVHTSKLPNLVVFRSLTKFFAMPGLRAAYAIAHPDTAGRIAAHLPPWPMTTLASAAFIAALADRNYIARSLELNESRRTAFAAALTRLGLHVYPGAANFLLFRHSTLLWERLIREHGIVLRNCDNYESLPPNYLRTAIPDEPAMASLLQALADLLS